ncbi:MAG TPA: nucleoside deaminase [Candidatus Tectomicrobia bacterium]
MTAVLYPQWMLDIVAPGTVYVSEAAIMTKAIALTLSGLERRQGGPFGAIVATASGEIIAMAHNEVRQTLDVSAHAEVVALRRATQALGTVGLGKDGGRFLQLFTTCEPCLMCAGAIYWAGLPVVVAAARKTDAVAAGIRQEFVLDTTAFLAQAQITYRADFLRAEALEIFRAYR